MKSFALFLLLAVSVPVFAGPAGVVKVKAQVDVYPEQVISPLQDTLFGINVTTHDKALMNKPEVLERIRKMGIKSCRFPNGCQADLYNWKAPGANEATVDEFLDFCDRIEAEAYYTINMQGGTDGLEGPVPQGTSLDETIRYRHIAPNPCGYTNYYFGTLPETLELVKKHTVERALVGKRPILYYEMGNENWGQSRTDWTPEVYAMTIEVYARAMRKVLDDAKKEHPKLAELNLYIVAVGFPVMGNNMKMVDTPDRSINIKWTSLLNELYRAKVIDAVQEHFYPYASANGGGLVWAAHNLHNIIYVRKNIPNERLATYRDPAIAYEMPMEHTEWNIKCWGPVWAENVQLKNAGFEEGLNEWKVTGQSARPLMRAARRGGKGLRVEVRPGDDSCEVSQVFERPEKAKIIVAGVWVRTDKPDAVKVLFRHAGDGANKGKELGSWVSKVPDMWERVVASAQLPADAKQIEMVLQVTKPATAYFDEVKLYYTNEDRGQCPISATAYEQQLFCVDAFREMALGDCPRAHLHHLAGNYPCGAMTGSGDTKDPGKAFEFFTDAYGDKVVNTSCKTDNFAYYSAGNPWATDFNALAPDRDDIPMLASMASRRGDKLHILLINRTSDRSIDAVINLNTKPASADARVRTLSGEDIDVPGAKITENTIKIDRSFTQTVQPYTAQIITMHL